jgi:hypothetical protein
LENEFWKRLFAEAFWSGYFKRPVEDALSIGALKSLPGGRLFEEAL